MAWLFVVFCFVLVFSQTEDCSGMAVLAFTKETVMPFAYLYDVSVVFSQCASSFRAFTS